MTELLNNTIIINFFTAICYSLFTGYILFILSLCFRLNELKNNIIELVLDSNYQKKVLNENKLYCRKIKHNYMGGVDIGSPDIMADYKLERRTKALEKYRVNQDKISLNFRFIEGIISKNKIHGYLLKVLYKIFFKKNINIQLYRLDKLNKMIQELCTDLIEEEFKITYNLIRKKINII